MSTVLHAIGYWRSWDEPWLTHPAFLVDLSWDADERAKVATYLRSGEEFRGYLGYSWCRFRDGPPDEQMGDCDLTDGVWMWPEGLPVYVERYAVRLPEEFLEHMRRNSFNIPIGIGDESLQESLRDATVDKKQWREWAARQIRRLPWWRRLVRTVAARFGSATLARW